MKVWVIMKQRDQWSSKIGFILAAAGSAIGLGAIWKFPYMAGTNGGSVFLLLFIICTIAIGLPILLAEFVIGRRGQADAVTIPKTIVTRSQLAVCRLDGYWLFPLSSCPFTVWSVDGFCPI